jgi:nuclease S1
MRKVVAILMSALCGTNLLAWSDEGHRAVAIIAERELRQAGKFTPVEHLLRGLALADIASCPDEVREFERNSNFRMSAACKAVFPNPPKGTSPWHFVDIPTSLTHPTHTDIETACNGGCVTSKINEFGAILADQTQSDPVRLQALSFLVHFTGDVHQPLHAAERDGDRGGNAEQIRINRAAMSLHHAWDDPLVSSMNSDPEKLAAALSRQIKSAKAEAVVSPEEWAVQSFQFARKVAYKSIPPANGHEVIAVLSSGYQRRAKTVVRAQVARAGVRLADFLSEQLNATVTSGGT